MIRRRPSPLGLQRRDLGDAHHLRILTARFGLFQHVRPQCPQQAHEPRRNLPMFRYIVEVQPLQPIRRDPLRLQRVEQIEQPVRQIEHRSARRQPRLLRDQPGDQPGDVHLASQRVHRHGKAGLRQQRLRPVDPGHHAREPRVARHPILQNPLRPAGIEADLHPGAGERVEAGHPHVQPVQQHRREVGSDGNGEHAQTLGRIEHQPSPRNTDSAAVSPCGVPTSIHGRSQTAPNSVPAAFISFHRTFSENLPGFIRARRSVRRICQPE